MNSEPFKSETAKSALQRIHEELALNRIPESALDKLQRETGQMDSPKSRLQRLQVDTSWRAKSFGLRPDGLGGLIKPHEPAPSLKDLIARSLAPRDPVEIRRWARQVQERPKYYEELVGYVVGPKLANTLVEHFLAAQDGQKHTAEESQAVATQAAAVVLEEPTLESAYKALNRFLQRLDPVQQFILTCILAPLFMALVSEIANPALINPVNDSPQGIQKQANARAVAAVGGTSVLADHRLVVANSLVVRASAAAGGKKVASLPFGTPVRVLRMEAAFTLVEWKGDGDAVIAGWVFSRYLKRFS